MDRIVYTRFSDGGVDVMTPTEEIFRIFQSGGWWDDSPIGVRGFVEEQVSRMVKDGIKPDAAHRFAKAVAFGGVVGHEAWDVLRARDCEHRGHNFVKMSTSDLPDRWFRNAWRQNSNGNITVDLADAKKIQKDRIESVYNSYKQKRNQTLFDRPKLIRINPLELESGLRRAETVDQVRNVWPEGLPMQ
jgi:hypothetical protein